MLAVIKSFKSILVYIIYIYIKDKLEYRPKSCSHKIINLFGTIIYIGNRYTYINTYR